MSIKYIEELPKCNMCDRKAVCDAPTQMGSWAYMCEVCLETWGRPDSLTLGTEFKQRTPAKKKSKSVMGIEDTSIEQLEQVLMSSVDREIECPECGDMRKVEPDAEYKYQCEGCGVQVQVPTPFC